MTTAALSPTDFAQQERAAVKAAFEGTFSERFRIAWRALGALMRDHGDTRQVFLLSTAMNARRLPEFLARFMSEEEGVALMAERPAIDSASVDYDALRALPADTLGGAYARFLDERGLDPDLFQPPVGAPVAAGYLAQRMRQTHDLWHVVTGYETNVAGELPLLAFTYGQTRMPSIRLLVVAGAIRYGFEEDPRIVRKLVEGYRRGKRAAFLPTVRWESMWSKSLDEVRDALGIMPLAA